METLLAIWHYLAAALTLIIAVLASAHAVIYKRDSRSAVFWVAVSWMVPVFGAVFYLTFGVNRIRRRARSLLGDIDRARSCSHESTLSPATLEKRLPEEARRLAQLARLTGSVVERPLLPGNRIEPLINGDEAYPAMLQAIREAKVSVALCTYIFDSRTIGREFVAALADAVKRGVEVRVIVDATGARYSWPSVVPRLKRAGVPVARFFPVFPPVSPMGINLRNHRKILVIDGRTGFTGGMNIRPGNLVKTAPKKPTQDIHFRVQGPVVAHLMEAFADDWTFCAKETLQGATWFPPLEAFGDMPARGISDGPDEDFEKLARAIHGALSCARKTARIVTPYFLPDAALISALKTAALRGVEIDIILPAKGNLPFVQWATTAQLWQVLESGCRVWLTPPPFDHSKLLIVDGHWSLIGSANWDPRSLQLNFEFNVECYDRPFAETLNALIETKRAKARRITQKEVDSRSLLIKLRDGIARLFHPFL